MDGIFSMNFDLLLIKDRLYVFIVGYVFIFLYICSLKKHTYKTLLHALLVVVLWFFSTSSFQVHHFIWLVLFMPLVIYENKKFPGLFMLQTLCLFMYTFRWGRDLSGYLFAPVNREFFMGLPGPYDIINKYYPADLFIGIIHSMFTAVAIWMNYEVYKKNR